VTITKPDADKVPKKYRPDLVKNFKGKTRRGCPNKISKSAKEHALNVADNRSLLDWYDESPVNRRIYWQFIFPKMIDTATTLNILNPPKISWPE